MEKITLRPITDENREAVLAMTVREDQPFVASNKVSLRQADEANAEDPGVARPFAAGTDVSNGTTVQVRNCAAWSAGGRSCTFCV